MEQTTSIEIIVALIGMFSAIVVAGISAYVAFKNRKNAIDGDFKQSVNLKLDNILQQTPVVVHRIDVHDRRLDKMDDALRVLQNEQARVDESSKSAHRRIDGMERRANG